ncbi:WcaF family extracellular polysaccharide biosynthesis acetyltransferase [Vibrio sp. 10N.261.51.C6]|uniref:WcaF family extracellular polysaccharide biosynthesis acetyltransferase n=1 Tax=Vibrio sp. 10N.261.51.C6 TaxID=3229676 RepID=UPI003551A0EA
MKIAIWMLVSCAVFQTGLPFPIRFKVALLRLFGAQVGEGVVIKPNVNIKYPWKLSVGNHTWIGEKAWIDNLAQVSIGANCCLSQGCYLLTGNHDYTSATFDLMAKGIVIEEGSWVGAQSTVCPGLTLSQGTVLSVGSVLTNNTEAFGIYQGNPAQKVKKRVIK